MKKKWFSYLFGGFWEKVPNFVITEASNNKHIKDYRMIRHDDLNVSLVTFKYGDETIYESGVFVGGSIDDNTIIHHKSLGDMFEYAVKLGNGEISAFYRPDLED